MSRYRFTFFCLLMFLPLFSSLHLEAMELDLFPLPEVSRDEISFSFFREERPSFYWVNAGVPDSFFNPVSEVSTVPRTYSVRTIEYGFRVHDWVTDQLNLKVTIPFEGNALEEAAETVNSGGATVNATQSSEKFGDIEIGATYLLTGKWEKGNYIGVDGWYRFPMGSNPFYQAYPLLGTGVGAAREALGIVMDQEAYGFSFFQSIHYENTDPIQLNSTSYLGAGTFQWPDNWFFSGKISYLLFKLAQRQVTFYWQFRTRMSGLMKMNGQVLSYGINQDPQAYFMTTDQLSFSTFGLDVQVDRTFSVDGQMTYYPWYLGGTRPNQGVMFNLDLDFRPN